MANSNSWRKWQVVYDLMIMTIGPIAIYYLARNYLVNRDQTQPNPEISRRLEGIIAAREEAEGNEYDELSDDNSDDEKTGPRPRAAPARRRKPEKISLNSYEQSIAAEVVQPDSIPVTFADIGGLESIISDLQESVIYPLTLPSLYKHSSPLLSAPSGVLLYGPPGCGKTMLAKALARESGAAFINLHISTLTEKWYGDSNKLVAAAFSLARKLAPAIVFVDEIDAVLGRRRSGEHEASGMVKAEMMTHWDGLASADARGQPQRILILGATNRPQDIDEAILRRMPKRFAIGLPDAEQRRRIFSLVLRDTRVDEGAAEDDVASKAFDLDLLVRESVGMSGSDIKEACREAAMGPMREFIQGRRASGQSIKGVRPKDLRGLRTSDFFRGPNGARRMVGSTTPSKETIRRLVQGKDRSGAEVALGGDDSDDDEYVTTDDEAAPSEGKGAAKAKGPARRRSNEVNGL